MEWNDVQQFVRIVLQFLGGFLVSKGIIDAGQLEIVVGALLSLGGVGWWLIWNKSRPAKT